MVRTQLQLDKPTYEALRRIAHRRRASMSSVVRDILHDYLPREEEAPVRHFAFINSGASGFRDTSERHDDVLAEAYHDLP